MRKNPFYYPPQENPNAKFFKNNKQIQQQNLKITELKFGNNQTIDLSYEGKTFLLNENTFKKFSINQTIDISYQKKIFLLNENTFNSIEQQVEEVQVLKKQYNLKICFKHSDLSQIVTNKVTFINNKEVQLNEEQIIQIDDNFVSKQHAIIRKDQNTQKFIIENQSENGTYLKIKSFDLKEDQCFLLGSTFYCITKIIKNDAVKEIIFECTNSNQRKYHQTIQIVQDNSFCWIGQEDNQYQKTVDYDKYMSLKHAYVTFNNDQPKIYDYKSTNGTWFKIKNQIELSENSEIKIGNAYFIIKYVEQIV